MIRGILLFAVALLSAAITAPGAEKASITEQQITSFESRLTALQQQRTRTLAYLAKAEKSGKHSKESLALGYRNLKLHFLWGLMDLERDLVLLATPSKQVTEEVEVPGLSSKDNSRIADLRLEILLEERKRIKEGIQSGGSLNGDERFHRDLLKKEHTLAGYYERAAKRIDREIKKLEQGLSKEEDSSIPDEQEIEELRTELDKLLEEKKTLFRPIFGYSIGQGFDPTFTLTPPPAEKLRLTMKEEREKTLQALREGEGNKGEDGKRGGVVGGSYLYSENLGVILDISGSMTNFIEPLKLEIAKNFQSPHYREVVGCRLRMASRNPTPSLHTKNTEHTMGAIEELIVVNEVDTVYWFCDLQDGYSEESIRQLRYLLTRGGTAFHVKSVGREPERELEPLITDFQQ